MEFAKHILEFRDAAFSKQQQTCYFRVLLHCKNCIYVYESAACETTVEIITYEYDVSFVEVQTFGSKDVAIFTFDPKKCVYFNGLHYKKEGTVCEVVRMQLFALPKVYGYYLAYYLSNSLFLLYPAVAGNLVIYLPKQATKLMFLHIEYPLNEYMQYLRSFDLYLTDLHDYKLFSSEITYLAYRELEQNQQDVFAQFDQAAQKKDLQAMLVFDYPVAVQLCGLFEEVCKPVDVYTTLKDLQYSVSYAALQFTLDLSGTFFIVCNRPVSFYDLITDQSSVFCVLTNYTLCRLYLLEDNKLKVLTHYFDDPKVFYLVNSSSSTPFSIQSSQIYEAIKNMKPCIEVAPGVKLWVQDTTYERDCRIKSDLAKSAYIRRERKLYQYFCADNAEAIRTQEILVELPQDSHTSRRAHYFYRFAAVFAVVQARTDEHAELTNELSKLQTRNCELEREKRRFLEYMNKTLEKRLTIKRKRQLAYMQEIRNLPPGDSRRAEAEERQRTEFVESLQCQLLAKSYTKYEEEEQRYLKRKQLMEEFAKRSEQAKIDREAKKAQLQDDIRQIETRRAQRSYNMQNTYPSLQESPGLAIRQTLACPVSEEKSNYKQFERYCLCLDEEECARQRIRAQVEYENRYREYEQRIELRKTQDQYRYRKFVDEMQRKRLQTRSQLTSRSPEVGNSNNSSTGKMYAFLPHGSEQDERSMSMRHIQSRARLYAQKRRERQARVREWQPLILY